ncbi:MAG: hypothetical protein PSX80_07095 [bacterium]|nr:hypothetical protein [bacterium]
MNLQKTRLHILREKSDLSAKAKTGVSLHCHTEYSREMLDFIPHYADKLPIINSFWRREQVNFRKREGRDVDFSTSFWSPPLSPKEVYDIEQEQISDLNLDALVSLTDHDSIDATLEVNKVVPESDAPVSMEWTVPFEYGFFHLGVHNLPKGRAEELTRTLLDFTFDAANHDDAKLTEMFAMLNEIPGVLIVLNHPLWDIEMVGKDLHRELLEMFISRHVKWLHAFEFNGFRSWSENKGTLDLAESIGIPVVTGGDRHGCKPNTVINLTNAKTFAEFADEVRTDKHSEVVMMPAYEQPLHSRQLESFAEILAHYPQFRAERRNWFQRVHFDKGDGLGARPLVEHGWVTGPRWLRIAIRVLGVSGGPGMRPLFRAARKKKDRVPQIVNPGPLPERSKDGLVIELSSDPVS